MAFPLFMIEIVVDKIIFELMPIPQKKQIVIQAKCGHFLNFEIRTDVMGALETQERDNKRPDVEIGCGKSLVLPITVEEMKSNLNKNPLELSVSTKLETMPMGTATVPWNDDFFEMLESCEDAFGYVSPVFTNDFFPLTKGDSTLIGNIQVFIRLTFLGTTIATQIQILEGKSDSGGSNKTYLFKSNNNATTFQCEKYGMGSSTDLLPIAPIYEGVNHNPEQVFKQMGIRALKSYDSIRPTQSLTPSVFGEDFFKNMIQRASVSHGHDDAISIKGRVDNLYMNFLELYKEFSTMDAESMQQFVNALGFDSPSSSDKSADLHIDYKTLTVNEIEKMLCTHPDCPAAKKFAEFGIGPLAKTKGLGGMYKTVEAPVSYGLSHMNGKIDNYGPLGTYTRPKSPNQPFIPKKDKDSNSSKCSKSCSNSLNSKTSDPLRLSGGADNNPTFNAFNLPSEERNTCSFEQFYENIVPSRLNQNDPLQNLSDNLPTRISRAGPSGHAPGPFDPPETFHRPSMDHEVGPSGHAQIELTYDSQPLRLDGLTNQIHHDSLRNVGGTNEVQDSFSLQMAGGINESQDDTPSSRIEGGINEIQDDSPPLRLVGGANEDEDYTSDSEDDYFAFHPRPEFQFRRPEIYAHFKREIRFDEPGPSWYIPGYQVNESKDTLADLEQPGPSSYVPGQNKLRYPNSGVVGQELQPTDFDKISSNFEQRLARVNFEKEGNVVEEREMKTFGDSNLAKKDFNVPYGRNTKETFGFISRQNISYDAPEDSGRSELGENETTRSLNLNHFRRSNATTRSLISKEEPNILHIDDVPRYQYRLTQEQTETRSLNGNSRDSIEVPHIVGPYGHAPSSFEFANVTSGEGPTMNEHVVGPAGHAPDQTEPTNEQNLRNNVGEVSVIGYHLDAPDKPLRLKGGAPVMRENLMPDPKHECQDLMEEFDKLLSDYKNVLGPCGQATCPFAQNLVKETCRLVCHPEPEDCSIGGSCKSPSAKTPAESYVESYKKDEENISGCAADSCPYKREIITPVDKEFKKKQFRPGCESPHCPFQREKLGLEPADDMHVRYQPCAGKECPFKVPEELPPIHWDCPEPLPKGRCKNPNCPLVRKEDICNKYFPPPQAPCGNPSCPYATEPCTFPGCPFAIPEPCPPTCPYTTPVPEELVCTPSVCPFAVADSKPKEEECVNSKCPYQKKKKKKKDCTSPKCPFPKKDVCENPKCPFQKKEEEDCGNPKCPFAKKKEEDCENPKCPFQVKKEEDCDNPKCPFQKKKEEDCENPKCPFQKKKKEDCDNPKCPFQKKKEEDCDNPKCPFQKKQQEDCENPKCPFQQKEEEEDCDNPKCPFQKKKEEEECENPTCPFQTKKEEECENPECPFQKKEEECWNPKCPFQKKQEEDFGMKCPNPLKKDALCDNPQCPFKSNVCPHPKCPFQDKNNEICPNPKCPLQDKSKLVCPNPQCPHAKKICPTPECPFQKPDDTCENPKCPFKDKQPKTGQGDYCNNPACPYVKNLKPPKKDVCDNPNCPFQTPKTGQDYPYKKKQPECENPSCPYMSTSNTTDTTECNHSISSNNQCENPNCPYAKAEAIRAALDCGNPNCPYAKYAKILAEHAAECELDDCENPNCPYKKAKEESTEPCNDDTCPYLNEDIYSEGDGKPKKKKDKNRDEDKKKDKDKGSGDVNMEKKLNIESSSKKSKKGKRRRRKGRKGKNKYIYDKGTYYPGNKIGHRECIIPKFNVPPDMGWLWNVHTKCMQLRPRRGWKPGAIGRTIAARIDEHRKKFGMHPITKPPPPKKRKRKGPNGSEYYSDSDEDLVPPKPTLQVKKKDGIVYVTMNPLKDPKTLEDNENPYMDCSPMQFKITKNKPPKNDDFKMCYCGDEEEGECESVSSSSSSELDIEFTPPAGIIHPERLKKKKPVVHTDTQYCVDDIPKEEKEKKDKKGKKGKDKGKKGKKGGKKKK